MSKTYEEILAGANTIKNERNKGANSATRIGQQFVDQAEFTKDVADRTTDLELKMDGEPTKLSLQGNNNYKMLKDEIYIVSNPTSNPINVFTNSGETQDASSNVQIIAKPLGAGKSVTFIPSVTTPVVRIGAAGIVVVHNDTLKNMNYLTSRVINDGRTLNDEKISKSLGKNLYNKNDKTNQPNSWMNDQGAESHNNENCCISHYILVEEGKTYVTNAKSFSSTYIVCYDENYNPITGLSVPSSLGKITIPTGKRVKFVKFTLNSTVADIQIEEGTTSTSYEPYTEIKDFMEGIATNKDIDENIRNYPIFYKDVICCDGDSLTWGDLGQALSNEQAKHNYPLVLQSLLGKSYLVKNCGLPGAPSPSIVGNATGYRCRDKFTIPASGKVDFLCSMLRPIDNVASWTFSPIVSHHNVTAMQSPAFINGVEGTLSYVVTTDGSEYKTRFTRKTEGEPVNVEVGDLILTNEVTFKDKPTHIIFMGQNNGWLLKDATGTAQDKKNNVDCINELIGQYKDIARTSSDLYICISSHKFTGVSAPAIWNGEAMFEQEFGDHYINLRKYMAENGIADAIARGYLPNDGTYPTALDISAMGRNECPPSLMVVDEIHLNDVGYHLLGDLVFKKYKELYTKKVLGTLQ